MKEVVWNSLHNDEMDFFGIMEGSEGKENNVS